MKRIANQSWWLLLVLLLAPAAAWAQEQAPQHGSIEFGFRHIWGDVYGRPDLPFKPDWETSKFNEYRDLRNGPYIREFRGRFDNIFHSRFYVNLQSQKSFYDDQSYLGSFGQYGKFKMQFRYEETPHIFSNTTRTLYTRTQPGVFTINPALRATLQGTSAANTPAVSLAQVDTMAFITPRLKRKYFSYLASFDATAYWNISLLFSRENLVGLRPIGFLFNSSPSASVSGGYGAEVPEPLDYFNNVIKVGTDYGKKDWGFQVSYLRSWFENNISTLTVDNPYRTTDCVAPAGCTSAKQGPATGLMDLYPDNHADYFAFAGAVGLGKYFRFMGSVSPGWLHQDDAFVPYTSNTIRLAQTGPLPAPSLDGEKQTLAVNSTLIFTPVKKKVQIKAAYRQYDYNNNTPIFSDDPADNPDFPGFTPVQGDFSSPGSEDNVRRVTSYYRKTFQLTGNWYFAKRSSLKLGYEGEWLDRTHRDVAHSQENSFISALDYSPRKDLLFRVSYRHSDRKPDNYVDPDSDGIPCEAAELTAARAALEFPDIQPCARRFDEAARLRDRGEVLVEYSPWDRLTLSGSFNTIQDDYNRKGDANSTTPLNFLTGSAATLYPYYLYGVLKDLSYNYNFDANYAIKPEVSVFAEYSHEKYHRTMTSRYRTPESRTFTGVIPTPSTNPNGCGVNTQGFNFQGPCDSSNNDWYSVARDFVDVWSTGIDLFLKKKVYLTTYYSLAAAKGNVYNRALGTQPANFLIQPTRTDGTDTGVLPEDRFVMTTTSSATNYPETVNRSHEITVIFKYKLKHNIMPRVEYTFQQYDYKDYQTSPMTPYMGCVAATGVPVGAPPPTAGGTPSIAPVVAPGCPVFGPTAASSIPSVFYPYFLVGDNSAARYYFLGVDQPSYRTHRISAGIQYTF